MPTKLDTMTNSKSKLKIKKDERSIFSDFCNKYHIPMEYEYALWQEYKPYAMEELSKNPYILLDQQGSLTFEDIDKIAFSMGIKKDNDYRLQACLLTALKNEANLNSSTGCSTQRLMQLFFKISSVRDSGTYQYTIDKLAESKAIVVDFNDIYLTQLYNIEKEISLYLKYLSERVVTKKYDENIIKQVFQGLTFKMNEGQLNSIMHSLYNYLTVISGPAGSGKSSITEAIVKILENSNENIILLSPTGKAAKVLEERTGRIARTIHRFIKATKSKSLIDTEVPKVCGNTTIIVDEVSMVDVVLFKKVIEACQPDTRLILVGDAQQLPSVQSGDVLADIIKSKVIDVSYLTDVKRQAENSNIIKYCDMINNGEIFEAPIKQKDFLFHESTERTSVIQNLLKVYTKCVKLDGLMETQVITPYKKGDLGVYNLNLILKENINPTLNTKLMSAFNLNVGDKVRHVINDYKKNIFNGEVGIIQNIYKRGISSWVDVLYDNNIVMYNAKDIQGSEYKNVIIVLDNEVSNILLIRRLVYTALSRARNRCIVLGTKGCMTQAILNNNYKKRTTKLCDFLQEEEEWGQL